MAPQDIWATSSDQQPAEAVAPDALIFFAGTTWDRIWDTSWQLGTRPPILYEQ